MSTTSQQTPPAPALTDTELTHLAAALTGYATSSHPAYRAAAARTALDALASIKAHIWESAAAHLECTQHLEAAALLWSAQPYYAPRHTTATLEQVRAVLAQLLETTATVHLTDSDRSALAAPTPANLDTCHTCGDLVPENSPGRFCSIFCQQQHGDTSAYPPQHHSGRKQKDTRLRNTAIISGPGALSPYQHTPHRPRMSQN